MRVPSRGVGVARLFFRGSFGPRVSYPGQPELIHVTDAEVISFFNAFTVGNPFLGQHYFELVQGGIIGL